MRGRDCRPACGRAQEFRVGVDEQIEFARQRRQIVRIIAAIWCLLAFARRTTLLRNWVSGFQPIAHCNRVEPVSAMPTAGKGQPECQLKFGNVALDLVRFGGNIDDELALFTQINRPCRSRAGGAHPAR